MDNLLSGNEKSAPNKEINLKGMWKSFLSLINNASESASNQASEETANMAASSSSSSKRFTPD